MTAKRRALERWGMTRTSTFRVVNGRGKLACFSEEELANHSDADLRMWLFLLKAANYAKRGAPKAGSGP